MFTTKNSKTVKGWLYTFLCSIHEGFLFYNKGSSTFSLLFGLASVYVMSISVFREVYKLKGHLMQVSAMLCRN